MSKKLASVQKIASLEPIEGADRIELAHVLGWQCVVNKGQLKPGDRCVYFEIDSYLPIRPEFEFLRKNCYKNTNLMGEGFKLRTMTFRGQISQGLCLPVTVFPEIDIAISVTLNVYTHLGLQDAVEEMTRLQDLERAREEQERMDINPATDEGEAGMMVI